jgi:hypothetical protein
VRKCPVFTLCWIKTSLREFEFDSEEYIFLTFSILNTDAHTMNWFSFDNYIAVTKQLERCSFGFGVVHVLVNL